MAGWPSTEMSNTEKLTHERLLELLKYNKRTGVFTWRVTRSKNAAAGSKAGSKPNSDGYISIKIDLVLHRAHRLAWFYVTGVMPVLQVDHKNRIRHDNRFVNLRLDELSEQSANRKVMRTTSSGVNGVTWNKEEQKWRVRVCYRHKRVYLGDFRDLNEAIAVRKKAAEDIHGVFASHRRPI